MRCIAKPGVGFFRHVCTSRSPFHVFPWYQPQSTTVDVEAAAIEAVGLSKLLEYHPNAAAGATYRPASLALGPASREPRLCRLDGCGVEVAADEAARLGERRHRRGAATDERVADDLARLRERPHELLEAASDWPQACDPLSLSEDLITS